MTGVITLFSTGLTLERRGSLAVDAAVALEDIRPKARELLLERLREEESDEVELPRNPIPGWVGLDYLVSAVRVPEAGQPDAWLMKVTVVAVGSPDDRGLSYGYLPIRLGRTYEDLVRAARSETLESSNAGGAGRKEGR